jgi:hypothetical protein
MRRRRAVDGGWRDHDVWGCSLCAAFDLRAPTGQYGGIDVEGDGGQAQLVKKPAVALSLHLGGVSLVEALEQTNDGFVACGFAPAKQPHQGCVQARDVAMDKARCPAPDADDHLFNELFRAVAPIRARLRQRPALQSRVEVQAIKQALEQRQPSPGSHFAGGEFEFKVVRKRHRMSRLNVLQHLDSKTVFLMASIRNRARPRRADCASGYAGKCLMDNLG